ncbi:MAG: Amidohydrolase [Nocardioidaceae bacterium]|nr:Amidohydrolase [Nocardioidaceae bacterium]
MTLDLGPLVDHHCHGLVTTDLDRAGFESLMNEAAQASTLGTTLFDSMLGLAIRRHCAPLLDLEPLAPADDYLARRTALGAAEVNRRMLAAAGIAEFLVDTGLGEDVLCGPSDLAAVSGGAAREVVRLERVAEKALQAGTTDFVGDVKQRLRESGAVGAKSIAAYRVGLELPGTKPTANELDRALAGASPLRLESPVVSAWLAYTAIELGLPLQFHVGYGDSDLDLLACDPLRLTPFLRATEGSGVPVLLLHNYPFHRNAAYLAQVFDHVFLDLGLATHNTGALSVTLLREALELAPFGKLLFSSDAYGLSELFLLGALLFRDAMSSVLGDLVAAGDMTDADAAYVGSLVARDNARRAYAL